MKKLFLFVYLLFVTVGLAQTPNPIITATYKDSLLEMECTDCNWVKLSFKLNETDNSYNYQAFNEEGAVNVLNGIEKESEGSDLFLTVKKRKGKLIFEGYKGVSWKIKEFECWDACDMNVSE